jgi:hypothetical protein
MYANVSMFFVTHALYGMVRIYRRHDEFIIVQSRSTTKVFLSNIGLGTWFPLIKGGVFPQCGCYQVIRMEGRAGYLYDKGRASGPLTSGLVSEVDLLTSKVMKVVFNQASTVHVCFKKSSVAFCPHLTQKFFYVSFFCFFSIPGAWLNSNTQLDT